MTAGTALGVAGASALLALLAGVPSAAPRGASPAAAPETETPALPAPEPAPEPAPAPAVSAAFQGTALTLAEGTHERLQLDLVIEKIAIGAPEVLSAEVLTNRELLLLGKKPGRTSLLVWFQDGTLRSLDVSVRRDLSVLEDALADVHPGIRVEMAPDREAVILSGTVPLPVYARRAEDVARAYLDAQPLGGAFLTGAAAEAVAEEQSLPGDDKKAQRGRTAVINLVRIEGLPPFPEARSAEEKLLEAIAPIGGANVTVRRIVRGDEPSDATDILVLEGSVPDQTALTRVLSLAYKIFVGGVKGPDYTIIDGVGGTTTTYEQRNLEVAQDINVIADESGALVQAQLQGAGQIGGQQQQNALLRGFGRGGIGAGGGGGGGQGIGQAGLNNDIASNVARAKALEMADGRILSFIEVTDIPQVRVDIRLYEVNRTKLLSWDGDLAVIGSDFDQPSLEPATLSTFLQGDNAPRVGASGSPPDIQNVAGFLGGRFTNQLQYAGSNWAVDTMISVLENEGIARGLANTSLSVLSGEIALFQVGGRVPVDASLFTQVTGAQGVLNQVQFIEFGVRLAVKPLVGERDYITIDFVPEVSVPDATLTALVAESTGTNPATFAFESRLLRTSARLLDGHTLLVGGLDQQNRRDESRYTPWLAKVPLVGLLFQGFDYSDDDLQVVVLVRPTIVRDPLPDAALWSFPSVGELAQRAIPQPPAKEGEREAQPAEADSTDEAAPAGQEAGQ